MAPFKWSARCAAVVIAGVAAAWLVEACAGTPSAVAPTPVDAGKPAPTVVSVTVSGSAPFPGSTSQFSATATLSDGTTQAVTSVASWSSSNNSIATVNASGAVTGVAAGDSDITATYQTISGKAHVTVARSAPSALTISGTLRDATSGGILPSLLVQATDSTGTTRSAMTDASGAYAISGVSPGLVTLTVTTPSYNTLTETTTLAADAHIDIVLTRVPPLNLTGTWSGSGSDGLGPETFSWVLTQTGDALSGSVSMRPLSTTDGSCSSCHKVKDGSISGSVSGTTVTLRMSFALGGSQPTPTCLVTMDVSTSSVTSTNLSSTYNGSDTCEPLVAVGSITMSRQ